MLSSKLIYTFSLTQLIKSLQGKAEVVSVLFNAVGEIESKKPVLSTDLQCDELFITKLKFLLVQVLKSNKASSANPHRSGS